MERNKTMKNKHITIVALAAAALATSCASEDIAEPQKQNQGEPKTVTLTASVNEAQTRVGMTKDSEDKAKASFYWHKGDAISVLTFGTAGYSPEELTTTDETNGTSSATFTGALTGTMLSYALYPHNPKHSFSVSNTTLTVTYNLPASYTYTTVDGNIFPKTENGATTYTSNSTNIPMYGTIASGKVSFKHIGGLAVIRIDNMPATSGTLTITADQQLSGDFKVSGLTSTPNIATATTDTEADKKVTFNFSGATANGVGVFYLPLATGSYTNLKIVIAYGDDNATTQTIPYGSLTVERKSVTAIPLSTDSKGNLRYIVKNNDGTYTINGHEFVDLGLDVLWAKTNVGADTEADCGDYYAKDDAFAWSGWGSACRMPTKDEFYALSGTWAWTTKTRSNNESIYGYQVTSNVTGYTDRTIFFPAAGWNTSTQLGNHGYYWSSSVDRGIFYNHFHFWSGTHTITNGTYNGNKYTIRAVAEKPATTE